MSDRRIIVHVATSADGYIARPDGGIEWLDRPRPRDHYGMPAFLDSIDTILWGRATYDIGVKLAGPGGGFGAAMRHYVLTHRPPATPAAGVTFVSGPVEPFVEALRNEPGKDIWVMGGSQAIAAFLDAGAIDAFIVHVIPVFIGEGIPLVAPRHRNVPLTLRSATPYPDGVVRLQYDVRAG